MNLLPLSKNLQKNTQKKIRNQISYNPYVPFVNHNFPPLYEGILVFPWNSRLDIITVKYSPLINDFKSRLIK